MYACVWQYCSVMAMAYKQLSLAKRVVTAYAWRGQPMAIPNGSENRNGVWRKRKCNGSVCGAWPARNQYGYGQWLYRGVSAVAASGNVCGGGISAAVAWRGRLCGSVAAV